MKTMKYSLTIFIILIALFLSADCLMSTEYGVRRLMDLGDEYYSLFIPSEDPDYLNDNSYNYDVLRSIPAVIYNLRYSEAINNSLLARIDHFMDLYYRYGYLPREKLESIPHGGNYVTAMDAPLLGLACELAYERTQEEKYKKYLSDLIEYFTLETGKGGYLLKESDQEWWPLEYAWKEVTPENAWYVSNGSFFGQTCIEMLKLATQDPRLMELSDKALAAYKKYADNFYYNNNIWLYYSLNSEKGEKVINNSAKLFIETRALNCLYQLTGHDLYLSEYNKRIELWKKIYPVYAVNRSDGMFVYFLRAGAPHPYQIDIYPTRIELLSSVGQVLQNLRADSRSVENAYIKKRIDGQPTRVRVYGKLNRNFNTLFYDGEITSTNYKDMMYYDIEGAWSVGYDASKLENNLFNIDANKTDKLKASLTMKLNKLYTFEKDAFVILKINNLSENVYPLRVTVYNSTNEHRWRVLPQLPTGQSLIILNYLGFRGQEWHDSNLEKLTLDVVTNKMSTKIADIKIESVTYCPHPASVVEYLSQYKFTDFWKIADNGAAK